MNTVAAGIEHVTTGGGGGGRSADWGFKIGMGCSGAGDIRAVFNQSTLETLDLCLIN